MRSLAGFLERQVLRLEVRWSHWSLDERLAAGFDPASDPSLALRAEQLRSPRHRRRLAAWIERLARDSEVDGWGGMSSRVPIVREQVTEARDSLLRLAEALRDAERVRTRGVAIVERLLSDSESAIYTKTARGAVELQVQAALGALVEERDPDAESAATPVSGEWAGQAATTPREAPPRQRPRGGLA
jgi:hypothetical protein